jgi:hypothetical protein
MRVGTSGGVSERSDVSGMDAVPVVSQYLE